MARSGVILFVALAAAQVSAPLARAACDPAGADFGAIQFVRQGIAMDCPCESYDGLFPTTNVSAYKTCYRSVIESAIAGSALPAECKRTAGKIFKASTCGRVPGSKEPCVQYKSATGAVKCSIKPAGKCDSSGAVQRTRCQQAVCLDAADTNGDQMIGAGDSGGCVPIPGVCGDGVVNPGEECDHGMAVCAGGTNAGGMCTLDAECPDSFCGAAGNRDDVPDVCRGDCRVARCGDGVTDELEDCDDGNTTAGDGCSDACVPEGSTSTSATTTTTSTSSTTATVQPTKKCDVDAFKVVWAEGPDAGADNAQLLLTITIKFKDMPNPPFDPACCEYRQNVFKKYTITAGPHSPRNHDTSPLHDDKYSRADDWDGMPALSDPGFMTTDLPSTSGLDATDDIDWAFTAEQIVIDTCNGNAQVAKKGPHTATIKGTHPRKYGGVPKTL